jgi:NAD(P)-dependent dehydrogenase (short-subunit alcohol dehydrogenase family)
MSVPSSEAPFPSYTSTWHTTTYNSISPNQPSLSASGKTVFITGGGSGIGARTADSFAKAGASRIGILGRNEAKLIATKKSIEAKLRNVKIEHYVADVTVKEDVERAFRTFVSSNTTTGVKGRIDILVSNAGYGAIQPKIIDVDYQDWSYPLTVNLKGSFLVAQAFLKIAAAPDAVVVNIASLTSFIVLADGISAYSASKAASVKFFDCLQHEHPSLRVVNVQPGLLETDMTKGTGIPVLDDGKPPGYDLF